MKSFVEQAQMYAAYHQNKTTFYTHLAGVPIIILSFMILLGFIKIIMPGVFSISLSVLITLGLLIYYFRINWQVALVLTPLLLILLVFSSLFNYYGPTKLGIWAFIITFVIGWGLQFYGHYIEGKKPAFMDNLSQALIAPMFLTAELLFMAGYMTPLKEQIHGPNVEIVNA